jgi:hypothetical protein
MLSRQRLPAGLKTSLGSRFWPGLRVLRPTFGLPTSAFLVNCLLVQI